MFSFFSVKSCRKKCHANDLALYVSEVSDKFLCSFSWLFKNNNQLARRFQPSQNVLAAGHLAAYNKISASYVTLVRLVFRTRLPLLPITIASLPTTQKHFDWAALHGFCWSCVISVGILQWISDVLTPLNKGYSLVQSTVCFVMAG